MGTSSVASLGYQNAPISPGQTAPVVSLGYLYFTATQTDPLVLNQDTLVDVDSREKRGSRFIYGSEALVSRLLRELRLAFSRNGKYRDIVEFIRTAFPLKANPQYGITIGNVSGSVIPLSTDNYMGDVESFVFWSSIRDTQGQFLDWVKEDQAHLFKQVIEDVSSQADGCTVEFTLGHKIINMLNGEYNDGKETQSVSVRINNRYALIDGIDGVNKKITLSVVPRAGDMVEVRYYYKNMVAPGLYFIEITNLVEIEGIKTVTCRMTPVLLIDEEELTDDWNGTTLVYSLAHTNVMTGSDFMYRDDYMPMIKDQHYTINYTTGVANLLPGMIPVGSRVFLEYKYVGTPSTFSYRPDNARNDILTGVLLALNDRGAVGQRLVVTVNDNRLDVARRYGGRWAPTVDFEVYAKDPEKRGELYDLVPILLFGERKEALDYDGVFIGAPDYGGFSEKVYDPSTSIQWFVGNISIPFETEWMIDVPIPIRIARLEFTVQSFDYLVDSQLSQEISGNRVLTTVPEYTKFNTNFERLR